jgi:hypothetical protein
LVRRPLIGLLYEPRVADEYEAFRGMRIGRGNRSTLRKPAQVPLRPPQIPHNLGSNPGRRGGKPATNRLSYGTAQVGTNIGADLIDELGGKAMDTSRLIVSGELRHSVATVL